MKDECWKKSTSHTTRIPYYINLETGESQWEKASKNCIFAKINSKTTLF